MAADGIEATFRRHLHDYLRSARRAVLWKLDGLGEHDIRRPLVQTGTNLLGLVKHLSAVEAGYFGEVFGRPFPEKLVWDDEDPNADLFATADESRDDVVALYGRACAHADIVRELVDGAAGHNPDFDGLWSPDTGWQAHHRQVQEIADRFR